MKIVSLTENTTERDDMAIEHGLSLYIETRQHRILFDMGQTEIFAQNAETLGINLSKVDIAVLSHGHYDHGGGLRRFLAINSRAPVYIHKDAFLPHYNGTEKYIGLDTTLKAHPRLITTEDRCQIDSALFLLSCNDKKRTHEFNSFPLTEKIANDFVPDDFRHEQYLLIEEDGKRVLFSGCSHKGILNIVDWFSPDVLIGGFHFSKRKLDDSLTQAAQTLASHPTEFYTCHCTGCEQYAFMKKHVPNLHYLSCGQMIDV